MIKETLVLIATTILLSTVSVVFAESVCNSDGFPMFWSGDKIRDDLYELYGSSNPFWNTTGSSMEPNQRAGEYVTVNKSHTIDNVVVGDVIAFYNPTQKEKDSVIFHRVTEIFEHFGKDGETLGLEAVYPGLPNLGNYNYSIGTQGDNNDIAYNMDYVTEENYIGLVGEPYAHWGGRYISNADSGNPTIIMYGDHDLSLFGLEGCTYHHYSLYDEYTKKIGVTEPTVLIAHFDMGWIEAREGEFRENQYHIWFAYWLGYLFA